MRTVKYKGMAKSGWNLLIMSTIFHPVLFFRELRVFHNHLPKYRFPRWNSDQVNHA
jgi:Fe2+ transport system protein B